MSSITAQSRPTRSRANTMKRIALGAAGTAALAGAITAVGLLAPALWLAPDLTMVAGISRHMPRDGRMAPRAVPFYNAAHSLIGPVLVTVAGVVAGPLVLGIGLTWLSHVLIDRALGYGLRTPDGRQRV